MTRAALPLAVALLATTRVAAASPSARLVYARSAEAASCPDETALRKAVAARFGYDPFFAWAKRTVVVEVSRRAERFASRVQILDEQGVGRGARELVSDGPSCSELFDATALAISIALDAASQADPPSSAPAPVPAPTAAPALTPAPTPADEEPPIPPQRRTSSWFAGVDALGSYGSAPSVSTGVAAFGGARVGLFSTALELRLDAPASRTVDGYQAASWMVAGELVPCLHVDAFSACAVGALGQLVVSTRDSSSPSSGSALFAAAGARVGIELPLSDRLAVRAHVDGLADLARPTYYVDAVPTWTAPWGMVTLGIGIVARIP